MPYLVMNFPDQPIPCHLPLYRHMYPARKSAKSARRAPRANPEKDGSAFLGLFCAILFDLIMAAMAYGLWEILNRIL